MRVKGSLCRCCNSLSCAYSMYSMFQRFIKELKWTMTKLGMDKEHKWTMTKLGMDKEHKWTMTKLEWTKNISGQ